jgi:S1-C subfamily serine protease
VTSLVLIGVATVAVCASPSGSSAGTPNKVVAEVRHSTFAVVDEACGVLHEGSSFVIAPEMVVTNAHVVAGATEVQLWDNSVLRPASVVLFDPALDVAVLRVPELAAPALPVYRGKVSKGLSGVIVAYPAGTSEITSDAQITAKVQAVGFDIYGQKQVTRSVYQLHVNRNVGPGAGGGPFISTGPSPSGGVPVGLVVALIFARSTVDKSTGFALAMGPVMADIARADGSQMPVSTGACLPP